MGKANLLGNHLQATLLAAQLFIMACRITFQNDYQRRIYGFGT